MRYCLLLLFTGCSALLTAQTYNWETDLHTEKSTMVRLHVEYIDDTLHLRFPDAPEIRFAQVFTAPGGAAAREWAVKWLTDSAGASGADSVWGDFQQVLHTEKYRDYTERRNAECGNGDRFCHQYAFLPEDPTYSVVCLSLTGNNLYIDFDLARQSFVRTCLSPDAITISNLLKSVGIALDSAAKTKVPLATIAANFSLGYSNYQNAQERQVMTDSLASLAQDMTLMRDTAFTVYLGNPGDRKLPVINMFTYTYRKANKKTGQRRQISTADTDFQPTKITLTVDSVFLSFSNYVLATMRVYTHENNASRTQHCFINPKPLSIASPRAIEYTRNSILREEVARKKKNRVNVIHASDVMSIDPGKGNFITDYIPRDGNFLLSKNHVVQPVLKPAPASLFRVGVFTDLTGFLDGEAPNGKFQTEVSCIIPMRTRASNLLRINGSSVTFLKTLVPEVCLAKLGDVNRILDVKLDTTTLGGPTPHVNHFDVLQHVNFWGGGRINIVAIEDRNNNSSFYFNFRFRYMRIQFGDTLLGRNRVFSAMAVYYEPELYYKRKLTKNFSLDISVSFGIVKLYDNSLKLSYGPIYGDGRDNAYVPAERLSLSSKTLWNDLWSNNTATHLIWTPQLILKYAKRSSAADGAFIRLAFPNSFTKPNGFLLAHVGFIRPFSSLFRNTKGK